MSTLPNAAEQPTIAWTDDDGVSHTALWRSESGARPPKRVVLADDTMNADTAYRMACEGTALLWRGDFQNARLLLQALARRVERKPHKPKAAAAGEAPKSKQQAAADAFHLHRKAQGERARILGMLVLPFDADHSVPLRRAPDVSQACLEAHGPADGAYVASLRELLGLVGAHEWRKKGVKVDALGGAAIHPHYAVFSPVRGEYLELLAAAPLPLALTSAGKAGVAFDIGTGTGVVAALLAKRGVAQLIATETDPRALACAQDNLKRLKLDKKVQLQPVDLFPAARAALIVCNPPWVPAKPAAPVERAIYDPESRMLRGFLAGLAAHLLPGGEGWLILSDLAEHLGLRSRAELEQWIDAAGLEIEGRLDIRPQHPKVGDANDPLHRARAREVTSLWRLTVKA
ncbi:class I SAM-dependent methyltransferase [Aquabacterium sp. OR-4]|uniref:class I SAM-dependent methyltransferase n=1 Tax=Aquabacterium sp. OR-4 TaxID=2978127 RepID=UPI0028C6FD3B|nr:class I SAM-dependent methyltransferase [Aquabacterium sp. OR-4]MDT7837113.1 class I SAM-dependent methyltransferase [Aquabacterium sp. OR-4]